MIVDPRNPNNGFFGLAIGRHPRQNQGDYRQEPILHADQILSFRHHVLHQQWLDTTTPSGKAMFQMLGVFAEFERAMIKERVRAGLARARSEGKTLGRPKIADETERAIQAALKKNNRPGLRKIASTLGVGVGTVQHVHAALG